MSTDYWWIFQQIGKGDVRFCTRIFRKLLAICWEFESDNGLTSCFALSMTSMIGAFGSPLRYSSFLCRRPYLDFVPLRLYFRDTAIFGWISWVLKFGSSYQFENDYQPTNYQISLLRAERILMFLFRLENTSCCSILVSWMIKPKFVLWPAIVSTLSSPLSLVISDLI